MHRCWKHLKSLSVCVISGLTLSGCSTAPAVVRPGDRVAIGFSCHLLNGELAATTLSDASVAGVAKAPVYLPRTGPDTIAVTAGPPSPEARSMDRQPFELEIVQRLASLLPGLKEGEQAQWNLEAERYQVSSPKDKVVKIATVRKRPKEMRLTREEFTGRTGKAPELGQPFVLDKMVPGQVSGLTEKEVVIRFAPVPGKDLVTPFGAVTVREFADRYELEIAAEKGRLIRTGGMVGRIIAVDKGSITIDYGHPFADEKLKCEVRVVKVEPRERPLAAPEPEPEQDAASSGLPATELDPVALRQLEEQLRSVNAGETIPGADAAKADREVR